MNIRTRVALVVGTIVAVATAAAGFGSYSVTSGEVHDTVDEFLTDRGEALGRIVVEADAGRGRFGPVDDAVPRVLSASTADDSRDPARIGLDQGLVAIRIAGQEVAISSESDPELPPPESADVGVTFSDMELDGVPHRVRTEVFESGSTIQVARSLEEANSTLAEIRNQFWLLGTGVTALAVVLGWFGARWLARPLERLSRSAEHVAVTGDLRTSFETTSSGEVGRVARSFTGMLATLSASRQQQHQLVTDAGHELRTPMTALRTNVELLASGRLTAQDERIALAAIKAETSELSKLTGELVELATDGHEDEAMIEVDVHEIAASAAERARRRHGRVVDLKGGPAPVSGQAAQLDRAISNLLDNAAKFSPEGCPIAVAVEPGRIAVSDAGDGIEPDDIDHVFERFYRSAATRTLPGSGLGLAIVAKVAALHGGLAFAHNDEAGATVGFTFGERED